MGVSNTCKSLVIALLMIVTVQSSIINSEYSQLNYVSVDENESSNNPLSGPITDIVHTNPLFNDVATPPRVTVFSPSLEHWVEQGDSMVEVVVITSDLLSLHAWQDNNQLLPKQSEAENTGTLIPANIESLAGVLQHRIISLPGWQVGKLASVSGTLAVFSVLEGPSPASGEASTWASDANDDAAISESSGVGGEGDEAGDEGNGGGANPTTWAAKDLHGATGAWQRNVTGTGVNVAIVDSGVDFAHPDLNGTQARVNDPTSPWNGWPIMFDPRSLNEWVEDGDSYPSDANSWYSDTSTTDVDGDGDGILDSSGLNISGIPSVSGIFHLGEHPDNNLQSRVGGDVDILVVDEQVNSSYDTVYVDLDGDGEFGDEIPMRKGSETAGLDLNGDGLWDRSAGLIYFIADGNLSLPYAPTYSARQGLSDRIPSNGDLVSFMINENGGPAGSHGTLCASSVSAQGVIASGRVQGMSPDAKIISVANYYAGGSGFDAWRFVAEGYDGQTDTGDEAQIGSFSFGYSSVVDAGSDQNSLYLDWLTRVHSQNTTYLVALGNGGHGYGTIASPGGAAGVVSVGAFSSRTSGWSVSTYGESASWSDRGPNSQGRMDPDLVTIGWSATGDVTLNEKVDANTAYRSWSGTSLATPVAAGLMALLYDAWFAEHGTFPNSQVIRDLAMSTAQDRAYDGNVQGAGWFDADRATSTISGGNETWWTEPAAWMPGANDGAHRSANINWLLPGGNDTLSLDVHNPTQDPLDMEMNGTTWLPTSHYERSWVSTETGGDWDGYQSSRPDVVIPILIHGDANNTTIASNATLVRARATIEAAGFDGDKNYANENSVYVRIYRWNDTDGDGSWWTDADGDGLVDSNEWESSSEYSTITEHMYTSPQVEARVGNPWELPADGILLGVFRRNVRTSQIDPITINYDITGFSKVVDDWLTVPIAFVVPPMTTITVPIDFNVPADATPGLHISTIGMSDSYNHSWNLQVVSTIAGDGLTSWSAPEVDGNLSNQSLYRETWMQGAQRWGWRAESGDWKAFAVEWPSNLVNGTIIVDVDWDDNAYTDIDAFWLSKTQHPYYLDDPTAYGQWGMAIEEASANKHRGSGIWGHETNTGSSNEMLTPIPSPGLKQLILHSTTHGVSTNDNPINVSIGFAAAIAGNLTYSTNDWRQNNISDTLVIGSTVDIPASDVNAWGWTQPMYWPNETAQQDTVGSISTSTYIREIQLQDLHSFKVEIDSHTPLDDLDLYLYRDINGNGAIDWSSERVGLSGNGNSDEIITLQNSQAGTYWIVVHGYDVPSITTNFWLKTTSIGGNGITVDSWQELNQSQIQAVCPSGCASLGGAMPKVAWQVNHTMELPPEDGSWQGSFELVLASGGGVSIPYTFNLLEGPASIEWSGAIDGSQSNSPANLTALFSDNQAGFNLSDIELNSQILERWDRPNETMSLADIISQVNATLLDGTSLNLSSDLLAWDEYHRVNRPADFLPYNTWELENWWALEDQISPTKDSTLISSSRLDAQLLGGVTWAEDDIRGTIVGFDGQVGSHLSVAASSGQFGGGLSLYEDTTMAFWLNTTQLGNDDPADAPVIAGYDGLIANDIHFGFINASGHIGMARHNGIQAISTTNVSDGQWHHISLVRNGVSGLMQIYVDGVMESEASGWPDWPSSGWADISNIGCSSSLATICFNGSIDEIRIYSSFFSAEEVGVIYNATKAGPIPPVNDYTLRTLSVNLVLPQSNLVQGWFSNRAVVGDVSGQTSYATLNVAYDLDYPIFSLEIDSYLVNTTSVPLSFIAEDNLDFMVNSIPLVPQVFATSEQQNWTTLTTYGQPMWYNQTFILPDEGSNEFFLSSLDLAGNYRNGSFYIIRDTTPPPLFLNHSYADETLNETEISINIMSEAGVDLWVQGQELISPPNGEWFNASVSLIEGNNIVEVVVRDLAGNWAREQLEFDVDSVTPQVEILLPLDNETLSHHLVALRWNSSEQTIAHLSLDGGEWVAIPGQAGLADWVISLDIVGEHEYCLRFEDMGRNTLTVCQTIILSESAYTPYFAKNWLSNTTNVDSLYGTLWLGPEQSWELFAWRDEKWARVHTGISPMGGNHTIPFELVEGANLFKLVASGFGIESTWQTNITLDTIPPYLLITSPSNNMRFPFADGRPFDLWIRGEAEPFAEINCVELPSGHASIATADSSGVFSVAHPRQRPTDVYDGMESVVTCSTTDASGNQMNTSLSMTFDGTTPNGDLKFLAEDSYLWVDWELSSTDDLSSWRLTIVHDGGLVRSINGDYNGTWPDELIELGISESGIWNVSLMAWDSSGNMLELSDGIVIEEPETVLDTFADVPGGMTGVIALALSLLLLLVIIDRRKRKMRLREDMLLDSLAQAPSGAFVAISELDTMGGSAFSDSAIDGVARVNLSAVEQQIISESGKELAQITSGGALSQPLHSQNVQPSHEVVLPQSQIVIPEGHTVADLYENPEQ